MNILKKIAILSIVSLLLGTAYADEGTTMESSSDVFIEETIPTDQAGIPSEEEESLETIDDTEAL